MYCHCSTVYDYFYCQFFVYKNSVGLLFFVHPSTSSNLCFLWFEMYFIVVIWKFYNLILFLYVLHWTTVFHHCLIVILYHFYIFVWLYQPYSNSTGFSGFFISSFISLYSFNAFFTETNSSWLIVMTNIWVD